MHQSDYTPTQKSFRKIIKNGHEIHVFIAKGPKSKSLFMQKGLYPVCRSRILMGQSQMLTLVKDLLVTNHSISKKEVDKEKTAKFRRYCEKRELIFFKMPTVVPCVYFHVWKYILRSNKHPQRTSHVIIVTDSKIFHFLVLPNGFYMEIG